jgi:hypothetical protein
LARRLASACTSFASFVVSFARAERMYMKYSQRFSPTRYTRKNLTSCSMSVNKLCSHCLSQIVNKFRTTCNNLVDIIRLVARLFQQVRHSDDITILLQPCVVNHVTFLLYHDCIRLVRTTL